jgi:hypothetical protein
VSISTYAELQTAVATWAHRADLSTPAPDLILLGEKWIFRNVRAREMETALSVAISSGVAAVPSTFRQLKHARIDQSPSVPLQIRPAAWIYANYPNRSSSTTPKFIAVDGANFIFGPNSSDGTVKGTYYGALTSIQSSANALFLAHPDLYLFAALAEAAPYLKDLKMAMAWTSKRDEIKNDINREAMQGRFGDAMAVSTA